ncbi:MAG: divergent PAP2 family protein [Anaerolineaceae bacterium]
MFQDFIGNHVLMAGLTAWALAQLLKVPIEYLQKHRWNWALLFSAGGMPSSHSALLVSTMVAIGLFYGFGTPAFALAVAITMVVTYDATGIRRQAGFHAEKINRLIEEFFTGHPINEKQLKEVLGHTPKQVVAGTILGLVIAILAWLIWR